MLPDYPTQAPDTFTASNGDTIETRPGGDLVVKSGNYTEWVEPFAVAALREYFTAERDEQLGRWRDSVTGLLVYPAGEIHDRHYQHRAVHVLDEELVTTRLIHEGDIDSPRLAKHEEVQAAARYFAAHPEPNPEPEWYDAQSGELWILTINGKEWGAVVNRLGERFIPRRDGEHYKHLALTDPRIETARRVFPEPEADDE